MENKYSGPEWNGSGSPEPDPWDLPDNTEIRWGSTGGTQPPGQNTAPDWRSPAPVQPPEPAYREPAPPQSPDTATQSREQPAPDWRSPVPSQPPEQSPSTSRWSGPVPTQPPEAEPWNRPAGGASRRRTSDSLPPPERPPWEWSGSPAFDTLEPGRSHRAVFSRIGFALTFFFVIHQLAVFLAAMLVNQYAPGLTRSIWYFWVLNYGCLYLFAFPVCLWILAELPNGIGGPPQTVVLEGKQLGRLLLMSLGVVYPVNLLTTSISNYLSQFKEGGLTNQLEAVINANNPWVNLLFIAFVAPVMEEILFRRVLYNKLISYGGKTYIVVSAVLFALFHGNFYQLFYAFLLGILFAGVTYYTGTIRYSIILHIAVNFIGSGVTPLLMQYFGYRVVSVWGLLLLAMIIGGVISLITWWAGNRKPFDFAPGIYRIQNKGEIFINPGMISYFIIIGLVLVASIFV